MRLYVLAMLALAGCSNRSSTVDDVARLELETLRDKVSELEKRPKVITAAVLSTGDNGSFGFAKTDIGSLAFSLQDVKPFADGSRIKVQIGNPTTARIASLKAKVAYGNDSIIRELDHTVLSELRPASWTTVTIDLAGVKPTELSFVSFDSVSADQIILTEG